MKFVMQDGRSFTDYQTSCSINNTIQDKYNIKDAHQYRHFLQTNAKVLMNEFGKAAGTECKVCPECKNALDYKPQGK